MATLFELAARLVMDTSGFDGSVKEAGQEGENLAKRLTKTFNVAKKAITGALVFKGAKLAVETVLSLAKSTAAYGDNVDKMSQKLGLSAQAYQEWDYIMRINGTNIEAQRRSLIKMTDDLDNHRKASSETRKAYKSLGLDMRELAKMTPEEQFAAVVTAFQGMEDGADKSKLALEIFGNTATELRPLLNGSAEDTEALRQELAAMGGVMSDDQIAHAAAYTDAMTRFDQTITSIKNTVADEFLPMLTDGLNAASEGLGRLNVAYQEGGLSGLIAEMGNMVMEIQFPTWEDIRDGVKGAWDAAEPVLAKLLVATLGIDTSTAETALAAVEGTIGNLTKAAEAGVKFVVGVVGGDPDAAMEAVRTWFDGIWDAGASLLAPFGINLPSGQEIRDKIGNWWDGVKEAWDQAKLALTATLGIDTSTAETALAAVEGTIGNLTKAADAGVQFVVGVVGGDPDAAMEAVNTWFDGLWDAGGSLLAPFGIKMPSGQEVREKIKQWWDGVVSGIGLMLGFGVSPNANDGGPIVYYSNTEGQAVRDAATAAVEAGGAGAVTLADVVEGRFRPHATGLYNVPNDGYKAMLHRGEAVLTRVQAQEWRASMQHPQANAGGAEIDYDRLAMAVAGAMSGVSFDLDGKSITRRVSRGIAAETRQRRNVR